MDPEVKKPLRFNSELLSKYLQDSSAVLNNTYDKLTCDTNIEFICKCGITTSKEFKYIVRRSGAYCKKCGEKNRRDKITKTCMERYGVAVPIQNKDIRDKIKKKCLEIYGVENAAQSNKVQEKMRKTNLLKYGVEHALQNENFKDKFKNTLQERYGVTVPYHSEELKLKGKTKCKELYGVENPFQSEEIKKKIKQVCIEKYGVEHPSQNIDIMEKAQKNAKKYKVYTMPSGEIRKIQGYEGFALDALLKLYNEEQIKTERKDVPRIKYSVNNKTRYYFPDIFIPHNNKIIEVKSTWTAQCKNDNIKLKEEATKELGYEYELWIFDAKGHRVNV